MQDADSVEALEARLAARREEHRALDSAIAALEDQAPWNQLEARRLKRRKLALKDEISWLEDQLMPDIIA